MSTCYIVKIKLPQLASWHYLDGIASIARDRSQAWSLATRSDADSAVLDFGEHCTGAFRSQIVEVKQ